VPPDAGSDEHGLHGSALRECHELCLSSGIIRVANVQVLLDDQANVERENAKRKVGRR